MATPPWRLIVDRHAYADFAVSVSPAIERAVVEGAAPPTVFLDIFDGDSVTIGINEDPEQVLDLEYCRAHGVIFRRRPNGGGPVYAGAGSALLVYFLPTAHARVPATTAEAFPAVLTAFAGTLASRYGFAAEYRPLNDVQVEGRKLIPTSLKIEDGVMTFRIVINVKPIDTAHAGRIMPMPPEKVADKALKDMTARFTCLEREAGRAFDEAELEALARQAVADAFGAAEPLAPPLQAVEGGVQLLLALAEQRHYLLALPTEQVAERADPPPQSQRVVIVGRRQQEEGVDRGADRVVELLALVLDLAEELRRFAVERIEA